MDTPSNEQVRKDILATMKVRAKTGNAQQEWDGFLRHPKTAPALREIATSDQIFGDFFAEIWKAFGARGVLPHSLIPLKRLLGRQTLQAISQCHKGTPCGLAADLLLKFM